MTPGNRLKSFALPLFPIKSGALKCEMHQLCKQPEAPSLCGSLSEGRRQQRAASKGSQTFSGTTGWASWAGIVTLGGSQSKLF